jgi:hypothetical protein
MRKLTAFFISSLLGVIAAGASDTGNDLCFDEDADGESGSGAKFAAKLRADELLVIRSMRWENGRVTLESELVLAGVAAEKGEAIRVREIAPACWQMDESDIEQYLNGVQLARRQRMAASFEMEFGPLPGGNARRYRCEWRARVESRASVRSRHADLAGFGSEGGAQRWTNYPRRER